MIKLFAEQYATNVMFDFESFVVFAYPLTYFSKTIWGNMKNGYSSKPALHCLRWYSILVYKLNCILNRELYITCTRVNHISKLKNYP